MQNVSDGQGGPATIGAAFSQQGATLSPSSETFSHTQPPKRNGHPTRRPKNAFDLYCSESLPFIDQEEGTDVERTLAEGWQGLSTAEKEAVQGRYEALKKTLEVEIANGNSRVEETKGGEDEDIEMGDETEGGSAAVNRG